MEDSDSTGEPYVMINGPAPSEAEHIYNRFFLSLHRSTYSSDAIADIESRRSHPDLAGRLFYDELLALTLVNKNDENAVIDEQQDPGSFYPPKVDDIDSIIKLIDLVQSSSFDRIKRMALWFYLMLDLDIEGDLLNALQLAKEMGLPDSARHVMTGYWLLDKGQYPAALSYLTDQPDFVAKILKTISPIQYTSTSREETRQRALAMSYFLSTVDMKTLSADAGIDLEENKMIATCWSEGVRAAWVQGSHAARLLVAEDQAIYRSNCVGRILEFCFMPQPRDDAVRSLLALPLSEEDEELLSHSIVNIPTGIHFTTYAHAVALDVLLVRRINSGQYYDALVLDRRINSTMGLPHLARDVLDDEERTKLRKLRSRREGLIKSAYSVMTRIERQLLEIGEGKGGVEDPEEIPPSPEDEGDLHMSWERVDGNGFLSTPKKARPSMFKPLTPLSASPAIRKEHGDLSVSESFLNAVAKASPKRGERVQTRPSGTASPLSQSILRGNKPGSRAASLLLQHNDSPQRTPSRSVLSAHGQKSVGQSSPLASARSYTLHQQRESPRPTEKEAALPNVGHMEEDVQEADQTVSRPYSRLADQIQNELGDGDGDLNVDRILSTRAPFKTLQSSSQPSKETLQASLSFSKPSQRYEARYEITDESSGQGLHNSNKRIDDDNDDDGDGDAEMAEVPQRRGGRSTSKRSKNKESAMSRAKEQQEGGDDESIPGSFPAEEEDGNQSKEADKTTSSPAKRKTARRTRSTLQAEPRNAPHNDDDEDEVPELPNTPNIRKSRSAAAISRSKSANKMASTPIRRSARLSVEPESTPRNEGKEPKRTRRATSKGPSIASASEREETETDDVNTKTTARRTRRTSKMPGAL